jgi:hypothetical protein
VVPAATASRASIHSKGRFSPRAASRRRGPGRRPGCSSAPGTHSRRLFVPRPPRRNRDRSQNRDPARRHADTSGVIACACLAVCSRRLPAALEQATIGGTHVRLIEPKMRRIHAARAKDNPRNAARTAARPPWCSRCPPEMDDVRTASKKNRHVRAHVVQVLMQMRMQACRRRRASCSGTSRARQGRCCDRCD